jgi:hypothetical protein
MGLLIELNKEHKAFKDHILHIQESIFEPIREKITSICEVGIFDGGSLRLWRAYFPNIETIVGIDSDRRGWKNEEGITRINGDIMLPGVIDQVKSLGPYDVIIDDGSHQPEQYIPTFYSLLDQAKLYYIVEDIGAYGQEKMSNFVKDLALDLQWYQKAVLAGERARKVEDIPEAKIQCVTIYNHMLVIEKVWRFS